MAAHDLLTHGVYIVSTVFEGKYYGLAVGWATQIATDKVLLCIGSQSTTREIIKKSKIFGISVLYQGQQNIGRHFGTKSSKNINKFEKHPFHVLKSGAPLLNDCRTVLDCILENIYELEDGTNLFIGKIVEEKTKNNNQPLVYKEADY